jgi:hypothetical protein
MNRRLFVLTIAAVSPLVLAGEARAQEKPGGKGLVIVAPARFHKALGPFVAHKKGLLPTELVGLEDVLKTHQGADDPERLKHYLFDVWKRRKVG